MMVRRPPVSPAAFVIWWMALLPGSAQSLRVYSEFARIDASGNVTAPAQPREILSPAVVRNGFTSFQIVVQVKSGTPYWLYVGENPDNAVKVSMYREIGERLEPLTSPYHGDATQIFWLDLFADRDAIVRRVKIEPELDVEDDWVVYPMEIRVMDARVPDQAPARSMMNFLCGLPVAPPVTDIEKLRRRNEQQDVALAATASKQELLARIGGCDNRGANPESYLRLRDYLFRMR
ncbi:MAG TPA: hypothetical protein VKX39_07525 [Bryobacteraceae bacterium]|jgi:hypothetical protein|nr:hypothetical protein [Bryobacteraceae bacterium]